MKVLNETCNLLEMANLSKKVTNLPVIVWVQCETTTNHKMPRIKFQNNYCDRSELNDLIPVSIESKPKILAKNVKLTISNQDLQKIFNWIVKNKTNLLKLWKMDIQFDEFVFNLKK